MKLENLKFIDEDAAMALAGIPDKERTPDCEVVETSIILPDSVCEIDQNALRSLRLERVNFSRCAKLTKLPPGILEFCTALEEVELPPNLKEIGDNAFYGCKNLNEISFPQSLKKIGAGACMNCESLKRVDFSRCTELTILPNSIFPGCTALEEVVLPPNLEEIGFDEFDECKNLKEISFPQSIKEIGYNAFSGCESLKRVDLSRCTKLTILRESVFSGCTALEEMVLPPNLEEIESRVFDDLKNLKEISFPHSFKKIERYKFYRRGPLGSCASLKRVDLSRCTELVKLPDAIFLGCTALEEVVLPPNLEEIGSTEFDECKNLKEISFPQSIKEIGYNAFSGCESLKRVDFSRCTELTILPCSIFSGCIALEEVVLPPNLEEIGSDTFCNCASLKRVDLSRYTELTKLPASTFNGCAALEEIVLPPNIEEIESGAFRGCKLLRSIDLPDRIKKLGEDVFKGCQMESISLPASLKELLKFGKSVKSLDMSQCNNIEEIPGEWFCDCSNLEKVVLPNSIKKIGCKAFKGCKSLSAINLPESLEVVEEEAFCWDKSISHLDFLSCSKLKHIGASAFWQCGLDEIVLPDSITELDEQAFYCTSATKIDLSRCTKLRQLSRWCFGDDGKNDYPELQLEELLLPPSLEAIDCGVFSNACHLKTLDLSDIKNLKEIGEEAFRGCNELRQLVLPTSIEVIGDCSFAECTELKEIELSNCQKLREIGEYAFAVDDNLRTLVMPDSVETIGDYFVHGCGRLTDIVLPKSLRELPQLVDEDVEDGYLKRLKVIDMHNCHLIKECTTPWASATNNKIKEIVIPNGVELVQEDFFEGLDCLESISLPSTLTEVEIPEKEYKNVVIYCYSPELDSLEDIVGRCACLYVLPQHLNNYKEQADAEGVSGNIEVIPDEKIYFYEE
jgi:hypothetical protein